VYGRRARRMIRRIDSWSVLKVSLVFYLCLAAVTLVAGTIMYNLARIGGFMARIERAMQEVGFENFRFVGSRTLMAAFLILTASAIVATAATVLTSFIYNLIAEVVGGVEISTLDEIVDIAEPSEPEEPQEEQRPRRWRRKEATRSPRDIAEETPAITS
jgi:MFS superfamily sulfate permease-like transporter